jgi:hypothetical protein
LNPKKAKRRKEVIGGDRGTEVVGGFIEFFFP